VHFHAKRLHDGQARLEIHILARLENPARPTVMMQWNPEEAYEEALAQTRTQAIVKDREVHWEASMEHEEEVPGPSQHDQPNHEHHLR